MCPQCTKVGDAAPCRATLAGSFIKVNIDCRRSATHIIASTYYLHTRNLRVHVIGAVGNRAEIVVKCTSIECSNVRVVFPHCPSPV